MSNEKPAPRLCTLWGSTFDANHYWYVLFTNSKYGKAAQVVVLSNDKHPVRKHMQIASHLAESENGFKVLPKARPAGELLQEAYFAIYHALHPHLCMEHALEEVDGKPRYEFVEGQRYALKHKYEPDSKYGRCRIRWGKPYFETKHGTFRDADMFYWFYPVNHLGQPAHGDAEALVNAYKEGE